MSATLDAQQLTTDADNQDVACECMLCHLPWGQQHAPIEWLLTFRFTGPPAVEFGSETMRLCDACCRDWLGDEASFGGHVERAERIRLVPKPPIWAAWVPRVGLQVSAQTRTGAPLWTVVVDRGSVAELVELWGVPHDEELVDWCAAHADALSTEIDPSWFVERGIQLVSVEDDEREVDPVQAVFEELVSCSGMTYVEGWDEFEQDIRRRIEELPVDEHIILEPRSGWRYIQFLRHGGGILLELQSNEYCADTPYEWTPDEDVALAALGWRAPFASDEFGVGNTNYHRQFDPAHAARAAAFIVATFRDHVRVDDPREISIS